MFGMLAYRKHAEHPDPQYPPEVHARLTAAAKESGQSLQQYVLGLISTSSKQMSHAETIAWLRSRQERMARAGTDATDSMNGPDIVREGRI